MESEWGVPLIPLYQKSVNLYMAKSKKKEKKSIVINSSFEELVKMSVAGNPKPKPKKKKDKRK